VDIERADLAMRNWQGGEAGRLAVGSDAHQRLFCGMLLETHHRYDPALIEWPELAQEDVQRLASLPIWDEAVRKESYATLSVRTFAQGVRTRCCAKPSIWTRAKRRATKRC